MRRSVATLRRVAATSESGMYAGRGWVVRIEGSYTVEAPAEQAYVALLNAEMLERTLPGCERVIQLGPRDGDGVRFEARVRTGATVRTVSLRVRGSTMGDCVEVEARTIGTAGAGAARGSVSLARQGGKTLLSYTFAVEETAAVEEGAAREMALQLLARQCCERLAEALAEPQMQPAAMHGARGNLALAAGNGAPRIRLGRVRERAVWMAGGLVVGVAALTLVASLVRRLNSRA